MKVIVCGAGQVGFNIARHLAHEQNDVTVIDRSEELINKVRNSLDVHAMVGYASYPDLLESAGAEDADMIIADGRYGFIHGLARDVTAGSDKMRKTCRRRPLLGCSATSRAGISPGLSSHGYSRSLQTAVGLNLRRAKCAMRRHRSRFLRLMTVGPITRRPISSRKKFAWPFRRCRRLTSRPLPCFIRNNFLTTKLPAACMFHKEQPKHGCTAHEKR